MEPDKMLDELTEKKETLETQLVDLERIFNEKREQYLKILGAIEALENLDPSVPPTITPHPKE
jgi:chaperonin cofactor prefoldin